MRFVRPAALATLALLTAACGVAPLQPVAAARPGQAVQARGFDLQKMVDAVLAGAEDGDLDATIIAMRTIRNLGQGLTTQTSADFVDVIRLWKAQRKLVHLAARSGDKWLTVAYTGHTEAMKLSDGLAKTVKSLTVRSQAAGSPGGKHAGAKLVDMDDALAALDAACEALLDRFPAPTPAMLAATPKLEQQLGDRLLYVGASTTLIRELSRTVRTEADVEAFLGRLDGLVAKAVADPTIPREMIAKLAQFAAEYRDLAPRGPQAVAEAAIAF